MKLVLVLVALLLVKQSSQQGEMMAGEVAGKAAGKLVDKVSNVIENYCISHQSCTQSFFSLKNYCCSQKVINECCNFFDFVYEAPGNMNYAMNNPRPINVILFMIFILCIVGFVLFCCCCCCIKCFQACCQKRPKLSIRYTDLKNDDISMSQA
jgi:hypothetical protein